MKKLHLLPFISIALLANLCMGQTLSQVHSYPQELGTNFHVRSINPSQDLVYFFNKTNGIDNHTFLCQPSPLGTLNLSHYKYVLPQSANMYGSVGYTVADMHVVGKWCYICGQMTYAVGSHQEPQGYVVDYDQCGYIAQIDLDSVSKVILTPGSGGGIIIGGGRSLTPSPNIKLKFHKFTQTKELTKMAVLLDGGDTLMALIGSHDTNLPIPCLVTLKPVSPRWDYSYYYLKNPDEEFTDVVFTNKSVVTVSRFADQHYSIGVRYANYSSLFDNHDAGEFRHLNLFNTQGMHLLGDDTEPTWRHNDDPIRMVAIPYTNDVTLAHEGRIFFPGPNNYSEDLCMYYIDGSSQNDVYMSDACKIDCFPYGRPYLYDMQYINEQSCIGVLGAIDSINYSFTILSLFKWNSPFRKVESWTLPATAMDVHNGRVSLVGKQPTDLSIFHYRESATTIDDPPICFGDEGTSSRRLVEVPGKTTSTTDMGHKIQSPISNFFDEMHMRVTPQSTQRTAICYD